MSNESLRKHLAEKVMDFAMSEPTEREWCGLEEWKPDENIEQAFMCLHRFTKDEPGIFLCEEESECRIGNKGRAICDGDSLPMAISLACARATGWKE